MSGIAREAYSLHSQKQVIPLASCSDTPTAHTAGAWMPKASLRLPWKARIFQSHPLLKMDDSCNLYPGSLFSEKELCDCTNWQPLGAPAAGGVGKLSSGFCLREAGIVGKSPGLGWVFKRFQAATSLTGVYCKVHYFNLKNTTAWRKKAYTGLVWTLYQSRSQESHKTRQGWHLPVLSSAPGMGLGMK